MGFSATTSLWNGGRSCRNNFGFTASMRELLPLLASPLVELLLRDSVPIEGAAAVSLALESRRITSKSLRRPSEHLALGDNVFMGKTAQNRMTILKSFAQNLGQP